MKKLMIIAFVVGIGSSARMNAQEDNDGRDKLHIGFKAGLNVSNVYDEKAQDFNSSPKGGFVGGAFLMIPIGKYIGVQPEVLYSQKGYRASGNTITGEPYNYYRTSNFLDIPVMFEFKPSRYLTLLGGPQYSYLLSQIDVNKSGNHITTQEQDYRNDNIRRNTLGAVFGLDIHFNHVVIGGRYAFDMQNNNGDGTSAIPRYKNKWFQGTVGYNF